MKVKSQKKLRPKFVKLGHKGADIVDETSNNANTRTHILTHTHTHHTHTHTTHTPHTDTQQTHSHTPNK